MNHEPDSHTGGAGLRSSPHHVSGGGPHLPATQNCNCTATTSRRAAACRTLKRELEILEKRLLQLRGSSAANAPGADAEGGELALGLAAAAKGRAAGTCLFDQPPTYLSSRGAERTCCPPRHCLCLPPALPRAPPGVLRRAAARCKHTYLRAHTAAFSGEPLGAGSRLCHAAHASARLTRLPCCLPPAGSSKLLTTAQRIARDRDLHRLGLRVLEDFPKDVLVDVMQVRHGSRA